MLVSYPRESFGAGYYLREAAEDDVTTFPKGRLEDDLRLLDRQLDDHHRSDDILELIEIILEVVSSLVAKERECIWNGLLKLHNPMVLRFCHISEINTLS